MHTGGREECLLAPFGLQSSLPDTITDLQMVRKFRFVRYSRNTKEFFWYNLGSQIMQVKSHFQIPNQLKSRISSKLANKFKKQIKYLFKLEMAIFQLNYIAFNTSFLIHPHFYSRLRFCNNKIDVLSNQICNFGTLHFLKE